MQALVIDAQNGEITVTADTQDVGRGGSLDAALSDLRAGCAGTLFTQTAEHVVLTQKGRGFDAAGVRERATSPGGKTIPRGGTKAFQRSGRFRFYRRIRGADAFRARQRCWKIKRYRRRCWCRREEASGLEDRISDGRQARGAFAQ